MAHGFRGLVHHSRTGAAKLFTAVKGCPKDYSHHEGPRSKTREAGARARKPSKVHCQWPTSPSQSLPLKSSTASKNITTRGSSTTACGRSWDKPEQSSWHTECVYVHLISTLCHTWVLVKGIRGSSLSSLSLCCLLELKSTQQPTRSPLLNGGTSWADGQCSTSHYREDESDS